MKLVKRRWLSWTIRAVLYLPLIVIISFPFWISYLNERFNRHNRQQIERRYHELVAAGKLEQPSEGYSAVTIYSRHGGNPYFIQFWQGDPQRSTRRYYAHLEKTPGGEIVWHFRDLKTKEEIY